MSLTLVEYDAQIKPHLNGIRHGASMVRNHVAQLVYRPAFDALAFEEIEAIERLLCLALGKVRAAKLQYEAKPVDD